MVARSKTGRLLLDFLSKREQEMIELLMALAIAESPSQVPESQQAVQSILRGALESVGFQVRHVAGVQTGGSLFARPSIRCRHKPIQLLLGHCDTVWPLGTLKDMPVHLKDQKLYGPGVYDMKGGLVQAIFALRAVCASGETPAVDPVFFINSDEEIGSPESSPRIRRLARASDRALVMEPSLGPSGKLKLPARALGVLQSALSARPRTQVWLRSRVRVRFWNCLTSSSSCSPLTMPNAALR